PRRASATWRERLSRRMRAGGRVERSVADWLDFLSGVEGVVFVLALSALLVVGTWLLIPLVLTLLEMVILIPLLAGSLLGRVFLGRPWQVEAVRDDGERLDFSVPGWREAQRVERQVALSLRAGEMPGAGPPDPLWAARSR
ncbi:MAG TPA: hypothetical protein VFH47_07020, partial [Candidatus Thermoplasmatota archaeon]|nr:hypothetical protein [Candidatus Thermoplasmatota archaeon]